MPILFGVLLAALLDSATIWSSVASCGGYLGSGLMVGCGQASGSFLECAQSIRRDVMWVERSMCREESNPGCKRGSSDALGSDEGGTILEDYQERLYEEN